MLAVKAQALTELAPRLAPMIGPNTVVVPAMNGVPWWFCEGLGGPVDGMRLHSVDPDGAIAAALPATQVVGCVVHLSASTSAPGVTVHGTKQSLILGEPTGADSERLQRVDDLLAGAGFEVTRSARVQTDVWFKLWGNMTMNPISVLTGTTMDKIVDDDLVTDFIRAIMVEARDIGARIGTPVEQDVDERLEITRSMGPMRTSMLQDADAGRSVELDALVGAVRELGRAVDVADAVHRRTVRADPGRRARPRPLPGLTRGPPPARPRLAAPGRRARVHRARLRRDQHGRPGRGRRAVQVVAVPPRRVQGAAAPAGPGPGRRAAVRGAGRAGIR